MALGFVAAWLVLGAAFAAVYQMGVKDGQHTSSPPGSLWAIVIAWPAVVIGAAWSLARKK